MLPEDLRRLSALADGNSRLKKILSDLALDLGMLQGVIPEITEACPDV